MACSLAESSILHGLISSLSGTILLPTALVDDGLGNSQLVRVLLYTASQGSFITEKCCQHFDLPHSHLNLDVFGLDNSIVNAKYMVISTIKLLKKLDLRLTVDAVVLPKICVTLPNKSLFRVRLSEERILLVHLVLPRCQSERCPEPVWELEEILAANFVSSENYFCEPIFEISRGFSLFPNRSKVRNQILDILAQYRCEF